ncbi:DUF3800 domain-containing protein [Sedimentisphaera salicampi]|uniref:DUF3800 domain-containing protein n=1 Tax=Sedimentisphaera salicampi TaxID=1941349 RepID=UPI000B9C443A|nr:DUF3800 domain-containing protein [Sedimentisphaera salicampi]OXU14487.1 hypothetical protein SMSP1_01797 [Sedimentisphaera salicampi]
MYLLYSDESGDPGKSNQGNHFILSSLLVHESRWHECFGLIKQLRANLKQEYGINRNDELHANKNIAGRGALWGTMYSKEMRVKLFKAVLEAISQMPGAKTMSICINKSSSQLERKSGRDIHDTAWRFMLQRFDNFISRKSTDKDYGIVFHDTGHDVEIRKLMRKIRVFNYVPSKYGKSRNLPLTSLIEDPVPRDSAHSQFIQLVDYIAYCLFRKIEPTEKYPELKELYNMLEPVALKEVSSSNDLGIVYYPLN